jgi:competence protein ComEC
MPNSDSRLILVGIIFLVFLNALAWLVVFDLSKSAVLKVIFFDIGQGDAAFIETPNRQQILIDGGPDNTILQKLGKEMPFYDRSIDLIILTHPESDHLSGLLEVLKSYKVENILWTGVKRNTSEANEWEKLIKEEKAQVTIARAGELILLDANSQKNAGNQQPFFIKILYPFDNLTGQEFENSNDTSIVNALVFGQDRFLFTGDASKATERELLNADVNLKSDILKIGHHGSKTSTFEEFLGKVMPEIAVISLSKENKYGFPQPEVLGNLIKYGIKIERTDQQGDIEVISDGHNFKISK